MVRIHLINAQVVAVRHRMPHAGLGYLSAALKAEGYAVRVSDYPLLTADERKGILDERCDIYGLTATSFGFIEVLGLAREIKQRHPDSMVVVGGPHAAVDPENVVEEPEVDYGMVGECEQSMLDFLKALDGRGKLSGVAAAGVPGLVYRSERGVVQNPCAPPIKHLDEVLFPDWSTVPVRRADQLPVMSSRGCPYKCIFCAANLAGGRQWRARSPSNVVDEIERNISLWGPKEFSFSDDNFNVDVDRAAAICEEMLNRGITTQWNCQGFRADHADRRLLSLMRRTGCTGIGIGIESANPAVLKNIGKQETIEEMEEGVRRAHQAGLWVNGLFMIGNPGDNIETTKESIRFAQTTEIEKASFSLALPYPRTGLWDYVQEHGRWLIDDYRLACHLSDEPVFETDDFTAEERAQALTLARAYESRAQVTMGIKRKFMNRLLRGEYFRPSVIRRDFRSSRRIIGTIFDHRLRRYRRKKT